MKEYKIKIVRGEVRLWRDGKGCSVPQLLDSHIENQTAAAGKAGIDRFSVNCACRGARQLGCEKFLKILAAMDATIALPDEPLR